MEQAYPYKGHPRPKFDHVTMGPVSYHLNAFHHCYTYILSSSNLAGNSSELNARLAILIVMNIMMTCTLLKTVTMNTRLIRNIPQAHFRWKQMSQPRRRAMESIGYSKSVVIEKYVPRVLEGRTVSQAPNYFCGDALYLANSDSVENERPISKI